MKAAKRDVRLPEVFASMIGPRMENVFLGRSGLEYWDQYILPFGWIIVGDTRHLDGPLPARKKEGAAK